MLKIAVFGTGGVGGIFGALFGKAGHEIHFIARGKNLTAIQSRGLRVLSSQGNFELQPKQVTSASQEVGPSDLVLVCVKAWQLREARKELGALIGTDTLILPLQNGVEASEFLSEAYPENQILRGFCAVISYLEAPGTIRHIGIPPYICFGELKAPHVSSRIQDLGRRLSVPGLVLETPTNLLTQQWQKFLFISSLAAITASTRLTAGTLRNIPESRNLIQEAMNEVVAIGKAKGISFPSDAVEKAMSRVDEMPFEGTTSMQRDFESGNRTELETFSGYITREGKKLGVPTPVHKTCYALLLPHELKAQQPAH